MSNEVERNPVCTIHKHYIPIQDKVVIKTRPGKVLCVQEQSNTIQMWIQVHTELPEVKRVFYVVGTGHGMPIGAERYIGTVQIQNFVWHVYTGEFL